MSVSIVIVFVVVFIVVFVVVVFIVIFVIVLVVLSECRDPFVAFEMVIVAVTAVVVVVKWNTCDVFVTLSVVTNDAQGQIDDVTLG